MRFLIGFLWFVILLAIVRYLYAKFERKYLSGRSAHAPPAAGGRAFKDPQCGMYVAQELALRASVNGAEMFFCSAACRDAFLVAGSRPAGDGRLPMADR